MDEERHTWVIHISGGPALMTNLQATVDFVMRPLRADGPMYQALDRLRTSLRNAKEI